MLQFEKECIFFNYLSSNFQDHFMANNEFFAIYYKKFVDDLRSRGHSGKAVFVFWMVGKKVYNDYISNFYFNFFSNFKLIY